MYYLEILSYQERSRREKCNVYMNENIEGVPECFESDKNGMSRVYQ